MTTRPIVRLRPKTGKRLAEGAPWAYANEVVMDRRTKAIAPGTIVTLQDAGRQSLGTAAFYAESTLALRLLDPDSAAGFYALLGRTYLEKLDRPDQGVAVFERARARGALSPRSGERIARPTLLPLL